MKSTRQKTALVLLILIKFLLQFGLTNLTYELHRDEFLHLDQGHHLAWGYVSVPPFTAWIATLIHGLGDGGFWIRFFPCMFGALTVVLVWKAISVFTNSSFALFVGSIGILFSGILRLNMLFQPNSMDVLCWTALFYVLLRYIKQPEPKWLYWGAVVFAIGFLNKYNVCFSILGLLPALLLSEHRKLFVDRHFYFSAMLGLLLILPNLIWQYNNNFPVFHHLEELKRTQLVHVDPIDFLKSQLLFFMGSWPVILAGWVGVFRYGPLRPYRFFFWSFAFTLAIFMFFNAKDYYTLGLYPIYIAFGSVYLSRSLQGSWQRMLRPILLSLPVLIFILIADVGFPVKTPGTIARHPEKFRKLGLLRWEDGAQHRLPQDFADMLGWKELAFKVEAAVKKLPANERYLIVCDNYGQAGAINYYSRTLRLKAVSFNADYVHWFDLAMPIRHLIVVRERQGSSAELEQTSPYFEHGYRAGSIENPLAREFGTTIFVFTDAKIDLNRKLASLLQPSK